MKSIYSILYFIVSPFAINKVDKLLTLMYLECELCIYYMQDRFAFQRELPPIDPVQDWYLTMSVQEDSYTQLEFHRNYITCDQRDREILVSNKHSLN